MCGVDVDVRVCGCREKFHCSASVAEKPMVVGRGRIRKVSKV